MHKGAGWNDCLGQNVVCCVGMFMRVRFLHVACSKTLDSISKVTVGRMTPTVPHRLPAWRQMPAVTHVAARPQASHCSHARC